MRSKIELIRTQKLEMFINNQQKTKKMKKRIESMNVILNVILKELKIRQNRSDANH